MTSKATAAALLSLFALSNGFNLPVNNVLTSTSNRIHSSHLSMSGETEVEKLRRQAAKAREDYERLSKEMGKDVNTKAVSVGAPVKKNLSIDEVQAVAESVNFGTGTAATQSQALDNLVDSGDFSFGKVPCVEDPRRQPRLCHC